MKDQEIKRRERGHESVSEVAQADTGDEQHASGNARAGDGGAEIGLKNNQSEKNRSGHDRGNQRIPPVVDSRGLGLIFEKPREKQDERGLGQFRRLQRNRTDVKPAVRAVGAIKKKNRDEQQRGEAQKRENQRRMLQALVVHLHREHHRAESRNGPHQLLQQEFVGRPEALLGHHRRGAEDHNQPDKNQERGHGKHPAIDANALSHKNSFHHGEAETWRSFARGFLEGDN